MIWAGGSQPFMLVLFLLVLISQTALPRFEHGRYLEDRTRAYLPFLLIVLV